jgi:hypothetical protein
MAFSWKARYSITIGSSEQKEHDIDIDDPTNNEILTSPFFKGDTENTRRYIVRRKADAAITEYCKELTTKTKLPTSYTLNSLDFLENGRRKFSQREVSIGIKANIILARPICLLLASADLRGFIKENLSPVMQENGIEMLSIDDKLSSNLNINESIQGVIEKADFIIVDLTEICPNIMYELGFAHALKKPTFLMIERGDHLLPSDIAGNLYIIYDRSNIKELINNIKLWIMRSAKKSNGGDLHN